MINANIPLLGQSPDMIEAVNNGFADGGNFAKLLIGSQANRMRDLDGYEKQKAFADNNFFGRQLRGQLKQDQATALQTQIAQEKAFAEIGKTQSEAFKNNQQGTGFQVDANQKKLGGIQGAFIGAAQTGDRNQILLGLSALNRSGLMTPEDLTAYTEMIKVATPEDIKKMAQGFALQNAKDPASHLFTSADNVLDNETAIKNNQLDNQTSLTNNQNTVSASRYSTDVGAQTAQAKLNQDQTQFNANLYVQQNKPLDYFTAADGTRYAVYANGQGIPVSNAQGAPVKAQINDGKGMSATSQKELFETTDAISSGTNGIANLKDALKYSQNAYDGMGAKQRAVMAGQFSNSEEAKNTILLDNIVTGNALEMLKATFGGAPTEGERAILLQLQGSANLPRAQREAIYTRAITMAENRVKSNQSKADGIRDGSFFKPGTQQPQTQTVKPSTNVMDFFK